jgi:thiol-disulfide isomerase/thioredoxin
MGSAARARARATARGQANAKAPNARQKLAARRAADRRAGARKRLLLAGGSVAVVVIAFVATLTAVKLSQPPAHSAPAADARTAAQVQRQVTSVPLAAFNTAGAGTATGLATVTGQPALTTGAKPEVLYIGGEYCPYCAAERWALAAAVSRFGTLSGLSLIHSSPTDAYPSTPTLSFAKASYASKYLAFVAVEWYGEATDPSTPFGHVYLQQPTAQQQALFARYSGGSIPFVDIGNRYILPQVQYVPSALAGLSWTQVAAAMRDPSSAVASDIDGAANIITAAICTLTRGQPAGVCQSAGVKAAAGSIHMSG